MSDKDLRVIQRILDYCDEIQTRIDSYEITEDKFLSNGAVADMLLMPLVQIGELATKLSDEYVAEHDDIPWSAIKGFRNVVVHDYDGLNLNWSWDNIQDDMPKLKEHCKAVLSN